jgi:hypothetical protein
VDEEQFETLKRWGAGLANDGREEVRAAGRAIMMLADEVDRLHIELWNVREELRRLMQEAGADAPAEETTVERDLRSRLRAYAEGRLLRKR